MQSHDLINTKYPPPPTNPFQTKAHDRTHGFGCPKQVNDSETQSSTGRIKYSKSLFEV